MTQATEVLGSDLLTEVASALTIVSSTAVLAALLLAWNRSARRTMSSVRRDVLRCLTPGHAREWRTRQLVKKHVAELRSERHHSVGGELEWLARATGKAPHMSLTLVVEAARLHRIAALYEAYSARLDSRVLLGSTSVPILDRDRNLAIGVADRLRESLDAEEPSALLTNRPEMFEGAAGEVLTWHCRVHRDERLVGYDLMVSHRRHRVVPDVPAAIHRAHEDGALYEVLRTDEDECQRLTSYFSNQWFRFDAAMPRVTRWAVQRDRSNGRPRLDLHLAECTFSTVLLDHYPPRESAGDMRRERIGTVGRAANGKVGMLTIALMVVTADRKLVFASRSRHVATGENLLGPTVSGNLELNSRRRLDADFDTDGIPDPIGVAVREAREELGLVLDRATVDCLGLGSIDNKQERGTNVLLLSARVAESSTEVASRLMWADRLEGQWEVDYVDVVSLPDSSDIRTRIVEWVLLTDELASNAKLAAIATLCDFSPERVVIPPSWIA